MKKLPNGFGQISKIKGLKKPYRVMICIGKNDKGRPISRMLYPGSYYKSYEEAYKALLDYHSAERLPKEKEDMEYHPRKTFTRSEVLKLFRNFTQTSTECIILAQMYLGLQYWEIVDPQYHPFKEYKQAFYQTVGPGHDIKDPLEYYEWFKKLRASV